MDLDGRDVLKKNMNAGSGMGYAQFIISAKFLQPFYTIKIWISMVVSTLRVFFGRTEMWNLRFTKIHFRWLPPGRGVGNVNRCFPKVSIGEMGLQTQDAWPPGRVWPYLRKSLLGMLKDPKGAVNILPVLSDSKALTAASAPVAGEKQSGRKSRSVRGSNHFPILSIGESTTPGSQQFTLMPCGARRRDNSMA